MGAALQASAIPGLLGGLPGRQAARYLLELDLTQPLLEERPSDPPARFQSRRRLVLPTLVAALHEAATDDKVVGLIAKVGARQMGFGQTQELRDAVKEFRTSGKPTIAWCETFGESSPATLPYYLATAFDEIWVQPSAEVGLMGVSAGSLFLAEAFERIGVRPQFGARYEYKNAANMFTERGYTEAHREAMQWLVTALSAQVVDAVAEARGIDPGTVRELVDRAPLPAAEAHEAKLVDHLGYRDQVYEAALDKAGRGAQLLFVQRYHRQKPLPERAARLVNRHKPIVALVTGTGVIRLGKSARGMSPGIGSDTVGAALRAAGKDDRVKAVVLRVNSPGGSYVASDAIWREVTRLREAGKPVVVSMGDVAASGGYFVSIPADLIVAQPGTLTGSIGVLGGKLSGGSLLGRLGIGHDHVQEGRHAHMSSGLDEYSEDELNLISGFLDRVYQDFVSKVAASRSMSYEAVHEVARGRVWTGADARERGLVDDLGGLEKAAALARKRAGLHVDAELVKFPHVSAAARLRPPRSSDDPRAAAAVAFDGWGTLSGIAMRLGLPSSGPLTMAPATASLW
ncbi:MAG TPA: signal peptide peptidase SppA [Acidimicrobiales bacterium]|nr:signal peptide peptidase SppA [Acidimicrobiales bacterium]